MTLPTFYRHGDYSRPDIRKVLDKMRREGRSMVPKVPTENAPGVVKTYRRDERVSETLAANGMITRNSNICWRDEAWPIGQFLMGRRSRHGWRSAVLVRSRLIGMPWRKKKLMVML